MEDQPLKFSGFQINGMPLKSLPQAVLERRATNHFRSDPVPHALLNDALEIALQAPSGYNLQPWRFIVVEEEENRRRLMRAAFNQEKVAEAPVVVIAVGLKEGWKDRMDEVFSEAPKRGIGKSEKTQSYKASALKFLSGQKMDVWVTRHTMIAVTTLMLAAEAYGLDTAPMEGFDPAAVKREFGIPEDGEVVALLAIGRMEPPDRPYPGRFPVERVVFSEKYSNLYAHRQVPA